MSFAAKGIPQAIPANGTLESTLVVPEAFRVQDLNLQLNISHGNDPDLSAVLVAPDGTEIPLFSGVGTTGSRSDFNNTIFDDEAEAPIANGEPDFRGRFRPQGFLSTLDGSNSLAGPNGTMPTGIYRLRITNAGSVAGTLNSWRLIFQKPVPGTGLGEPVADRTAADFRIFTMATDQGLASSTWTAVGPASINNGAASGRVTGLAVDPSDPSGNTVFVGGASGGVWKTNNFLTTDPEGPTWTPLLDRVATYGMNIGGIAVFGRNDDPNQSIVFAATGEGDTSSRGVGLLRSMDGGLTWELLDSTDNTLPFDQRSHNLVGLTAFDVVVDPRPTSTGDAIVYAALSGTGANDGGGIYKSRDSGRTWTRVLDGEATDVELDPTSGTVTTFNPTGNLQRVFAAIRGRGVLMSTAEGRSGSWALMAGGVGKPDVLDGDVAPIKPVPVQNKADTPNGAKGRIVLAKAQPTGDPLQDLVTQGWLYAAVATPDDHLDGLYMTKDYGLNWTRLQIPTLPSAPNTNFASATPTNDTSQPDYDPLGNTQFAQGNYDIALTVDPTDPNVVYLGGTRDGQESGLIRVDATNVNDPHAFFLDNNLPGGAVRRNYVNGAVTVEPSDPSDQRDSFPSGFDPRTDPTMNLLRNPSDPRSASNTVIVDNAGMFSNSGAGVRWTPFDAVTAGTTDVHRALSFVDPLTGRGRLIFGDDQGIFTGVDAGDGTLLQQFGTFTVPTHSRNGNLQITQLYYGAAQPSDLTAQIAGALLYGQAQDDGDPRSDPKLLQNGNITWTGPLGDGTGVATDQTGTGTAYYYNWPCCGGEITQFFRVDTPDRNPNNGVGETRGLLLTDTGTQVPDPEWPFLGGANFAVNPINPREIAISAPGNFNGTGRVFRTLDQGLTWSVIGEPSVLGDAYFPTLAFGAPVDPTSGITGDYIIGGNTKGQLYVTFDGGGTWTQLNTGDLASNTSPFRAIAPNPTPGSFEAYAVTADGVYHIADTRPGSGAVWKDITGNLFQITHQIFGDPNFTDTLLKPGNLKALSADWRYVIPDDFNNPPQPASDPARTHPVLYVAGEGGVFASYDDGGTWQRFPSAFANSLSTTPTPPGAGGGLPVADVRDLDLSLGHVDPITGRPQAQVTVPGPDGVLGTADDQVANSPDLLVATTFGRGAYAIRLAPVIFPDSLRLDVGGRRIAAGGQPPMVRPSDLTFEGFSAQTAAGNTVTLKAFEIGADDQVLRELPIVGGTVTTDSTGRFTFQVAPGAFATDGTKRIGIQAVDQAGVAGNVALFSVTLDVTPPVPPAAPDLVDTSDSGSDNTDNLTNASDLAFSVAGLEANAVVQLFRDGQQVSEVTAGGAGGTVTITDDSTPAEGSHRYKARQVDQIGNVGGFGPELVVTIDRTSPMPPAPSLLPDDDTEMPGDATTSIRQPRLTGSVAGEPMPEALPPVQLIGAGGAVLGQASPGPDGTYTIQLDRPLADGTYDLRARVTDLAGNVGVSAPFRLTIMQPPGSGPQLRTPELMLATESDTGVVGDGQTADRRPVLVGTADPKVTVEIVGPDGAVLSRGRTDDQGRFRLQLASDLVNGAIVLRARTRDDAGNMSDLSAPMSLTIVTTGGDYGAAGAAGATSTDGVADLALFRRDTAAGQGVFYASITGGGSLTQAFGEPGDIPVTGDFDGDGVNDFAVFRPNSDTMPGASEWFILGSRSGARHIFFGGSGLDLPAPADYTGDGITDIAVFRPVSDLVPGAAQWFILPSEGGPAFSVLFGGAGGLDQPAPADYDGDGRADIAAYRPVSDLILGAAQWFILPSSKNDTTFSQRLGGYPVQFGQAGVDQPVPADYDGDGKADIAAYRPTTSEWFILRSTAGAFSTAFGAPGDIPAPADYTGDGAADLTVFRPSAGQWTTRPSGGGSDQVRTFGGPDDIPVLSPLAYRDPRPNSIVATSADPSSSAAGSSGVGVARQSASVAPAGSLDLGGQAARFSAAGLGRSTASAAQAAQATPSRPAQAVATAVAARLRRLAIRPAQSGARLADIEARLAALLPPGSDG